MYRLVREAARRVSLNEPGKFALREGEGGDAKLRGDEKPRSENARATERAETHLFSLLPRTSLRRIELPEYRDIRAIASHPILSAL
jgi:hypothetical protein